MSVVTVPAKPSCVIECGGVDEERLVRIFIEILFEDNTAVRKTDSFALMGADLFEHVRIA